MTATNRTIALPVVLTSIPVCGVRKRGYIATCGRCGVQQAIACNTFACGKQRDADIAEERFVRNKFTGLNWHLGRSEETNRCPNCKFAAINAAMARRKKEKEMTMNGTTPGKQAAPAPASKPIEAPKADAPPVMGRDDRRLIFEKINEVYDTNRYANGWSDARIATDLGIPRAWVSELRREFFGDEGSNDEIKQAVAEAVNLLAEIKKATEALTPHFALLRTLADKSERIERKVMEIEKGIK